MPVYLLPDINVPMPIEMLLKEISEKHGLKPWQLKSKHRYPKYSKARKEFSFRASKAGYTQKQIAEILDRERSSISHLIECWKWHEKNKQKEVPYS